MRAIQHFIFLSLFLAEGAAWGQASPAAFQSASRYDESQQLVGTIAPDPDGSGPLQYAATRNSYDADGNLIKVETGELSSWKTEATLPKDWGSSFTVYSVRDMSYDLMHRKTLDKLTVGSAQSVTQYSYDALGRPECTAVRMTQSTFGALPGSACDQSSGGTDRITKNFYDATGQLLQTRRGVGTSLEQGYISYSYTTNGKQDYVIDANGNRARFIYDGFDRLYQWQFPSTTRPGAFNGSSQASALSSAGAVNTGDYEQYGYDANSNRSSLRKRDGSIITYTHDPLNRIKTQDAPGAANDMTYSYDLQGHRRTALFTSGGLGITNEYDGFGRPTSMTTTTGGVTRQISYQYDADDNRTHVTHPGGAPDFVYDYDGLDRPTTVKDGGTTLFGYVYDAQGRRTTINRGSGTSVATTSFLYDGAYGANAACQPAPGDQVAGRLTCINQDLGGNWADQAIRFAYNPANQVVARTTSNDAYAWTAHYNVNRGYTTNGLNQYSAAGPAAFGYDANGNLTSDGSTTYTYDVENRLISATGARNAALSYDPMGRLFQVTGSSGTTQFLYDGDALVAEYDGAGTLLRRYVHGPNADEPEAWYENGSLRYLHTDHQGSIVAISDAAGNPVTLNAYDEYGIPQATNLGRFQYTGQIWLPEVGLYHYKARVYSPTLGRFMQTDPIGYKDQFNLYEYVGDDPINHADPSGNCFEDLCIGEGAFAACLASQACTAGAVTIGSGIIYYGGKLLGSILSSVRSPETTLNPDRQGKHQPGHNNYIPGRSILTDPDPQGLIDQGTGTGVPHGNAPVPQPGSKEVVDYGRPIGVNVNPNTGQESETSRGTIHYGSKGAHVVPAPPAPSTQTKPSPRSMMDTCRGTHLNNESGSIC